MSKIDKSYNNLLREILNKGSRYLDPNRKDVYRLQIPSYSFVHNFDDGFPVLTTKKVYWKGVVTELLWFLRGDTSTKFLIDNNVNIWNKDGVNYLNRQNGTDLTEEEYKEKVKNEGLESGLGRVYGAQWRSFNGLDEKTLELNKTDQIQNLINNLIKTPLATRHMVTAWNPSELGVMALPPCHWGFEILVEPISDWDRKNMLSKTDTWKDVPFYMIDEDPSGDILDSCDEENIPKYQFTLKWHQRSVDTFLGLPFNIASYALLAEIIGKLTNMKPKGIIGDLSNVHIYEPHLDAVKEQLSRGTKHFSHNVSLKEISGFKMDMGCDINNWLNSKEISDFKLQDYQSFPSISAEMLPYDK